MRIESKTHTDIRIGGMKIGTIPKPIGRYTGLT